jgi:predicted PurR-regulated permease PerM
MELHTGNSSVLKVILIGAGAFIITWGMKWSAPILNPVLLAGIIWIIIVPLAVWLVKKGFPDWLAILITFLLLVVALVGLILLTSYSVTVLIESLPQYQDSLQTQIDSLESALNTIGLSEDRLSSALDQISGNQILSYVSSLLAGVLGFLSNLTFVLLVLIFLLLGTRGFTNTMRSFGTGSATVPRFNRMVEDLRQYMVLTTWINLMVALISTIFFFITGVDFAILWGILTFLLGYIPTLGFWLALIPPLALAYLQYGAARALIVLVGIAVINTVVQNFVQPRMMGRGLNLAPVVVILSLFFWGWVLGLTGALLAVPLTLIVKELILDAYDDTRGLARLMDDPSAIVDQPGNSPAS